MLQRSPQERGASMSFLNRMRYFNKRLLNRVTIKIAGFAHSPISIVNHVGRKSGKTYQTPIIVEPQENGFVFALTYGPQVDWYRNILAAGHCNLRWHGDTYALGEPEPIDVEAALPAFPLPFRPVLRILGKKDFFRMVIQEDKNSQPGEK
jgi:deazaflavin-dependent oxidoreductase (nitroreductase family)